NFPPRNMGGHEERELSSVFQVLPQFALKARGIVSMRGWEMRWKILIMQRVGDEGGFCVVAESCHQTSEGIGLMASQERPTYANIYYLFYSNKE
ncbi:MAG: hypothetical protein AB7D01_06860, partial [Methanoculleus sp.]